MKICPICKVRNFKEDRMDRCWVCQVKSLKLPPHMSVEVLLVRKETKKMDQKEFERRLAQARAGDQLVYHVGESLRECRAKRAALRAFYDGRCELSQRRLSADGLFAYVATRRKCIRPPSYPLHLEPTIFAHTANWNGR